MQFADVACALKTQTAIIHMILYKVYRVCVLLSIYNLMPNVKSTSSIHSEQKLRFLRYIVFYCELGCDTSEPHVSCISRACSSLVRQPYYAPNSFILKISGLETIFVTKKGSLNGRTFYIDEYTLIFLFSQCIRCAQKRDCWESVRFASERSRVRIPLGPPNKKNPNPFPIGEGFGFFVFFGYNNEGSRGRRKTPMPCHRP